MAVLVIGGFLYWVLATTPGGRWALVTATMQAEGSVSGVSGSVWKGLQIGHLYLPAGPVTVELNDFDLHVQWAALLDRQLHIRNLSAGRLDIALTQDDEPQTASDPFSMPVLPLELRVDRLALDEFSMSVNKKPVPVAVSDFATSLYLGGKQGQLRLNSLRLSHEQADVHLDGDVQVLNLEEPWPFDAELRADVQGKGADSMLCARRYVPTLPQGTVVTARPVKSDDNTDSPEDAATRPDTASALPVTDAALPPPATGTVPSVTGPCIVDVHVSAKGNLQDLAVTARATGQGMNLDAELELTPQAGFPLKDARIALTLADESSLHLDVDWVSQDVTSSGPTPAVAHDQLRGTLQTTRLNVGQLAGPLLPTAVLTTSGHFEAQIRNRNQLVASRIELDVAQGSVWNEQPLTGQVNASVSGVAPALPAADGAPTPGHTAATTEAPLWQTMQVRDLDIDVQLGDNHVQASGVVGVSDSDLALQIQAPALASFWPGLPGGLNLDAQLGGAIHDHALTLDATYTPDDTVPDILGQASAQLSLDIKGGWRLIDMPGSAQGASEGWEGQIQKLEASHAGLGLVVTQTPSLRLVPGATTADGLWRLGSANIGLSLDTRPVLQLAHKASSGGAGGQWATAGEITRLVVSQALIDDVHQIVSRAPGAVDSAKPLKQGGVKVRGANNDVTEITLALDWDLKFDQALAGNVSARHVSGDVMVPADPPFPLGLQTFTLDVAARPLDGALSQLGADLSVVTAEMGRASASVAVRLRATPGGGFALDMQGATIDADAAIDDLGWVSLFAGDAMDFGGRINADVRLTNQGDDRWDSSGTITGDHIRIVRIDDGVRLLDGTLAARLEGERVILEKLEFPAQLRVEPQEWRTAEWVSTNPDARDGYLRLTGEWHLSDMAGNVDVNLHRYPVLQRSDRYAMVTGVLHIDAALPALSITGRIEADAGWINLDMLGGIPTVDSDVVVIRAGDDPMADVQVPMDLSMDIEVDLGPRVYLTGYGVNSGLVGTMRIMMIDNKLTAVGALRTRGGAIEAYGQRLQLRRGTITFQGDIASPILSIEALRTGQPVEAGVRVSGTARRPAIELVSYPDVSDIEKLSWLLFGHGPDESGGDMALLLSVGTSFLGDGEPFYRKFGIDELSLQSGDIGSAGSILPAESVVSGLNSGASDLERQFISASKGVARGFTLSVRQALSDAGTVGRVSYRLARGLTAELSVGSVNGLALVYRWFSRTR